jgi:hypothetical protein
LKFVREHVEFCIITTKKRLRKVSLQKSCDFIKEWFLLNSHILLFFALLRHLFDSDLPLPISNWELKALLDFLFLFFVNPLVARLG